MARGVWTSQLAALLATALVSAPCLAKAPRPHRQAPARTARAKPAKSMPKPAPIAPSISPGPVGQLEPLRDPSGKSLQAWQAGLQRADAKAGQARALFFGASHTAADLWTGELRRTWQNRHGEGGHGFVLPSKWNVGYRQQDLKVAASAGWQILRHKREEGAAVGDYGLLGVAMQGDNPLDFAEIQTTTDNPQGRKFDRLEVWIKPQTGGGDLLLNIDGQAHTIPTGPAADAYVRFKLADTGHAVRLQPAGNGPVVVFGLIAERSAPGVILDQLGTPGMRAEILLHWAEPRWSEQVRRREPDLIVLAYGTNDVTEEDETLDHYEQDWLRVLAQVKRAAPRAACVLVGPTDRLVGRGAARVPAPRTPAVIEVQRKVAAQAGCAHWDAVAAMGGPGSMLRWQAAGWAQRDGVHLNREGYARLAELFDAALRAPSAPR